MRIGRHFALTAVACALLFSPALAEEKEFPSDLVDLNSAIEAELIQLPGVGEVIAQRIIRHREISGPFRSVNELLVIRGISRKKLEALRPLVTARMDSDGQESSQSDCRDGCYALLVLRGGEDTLQYLLLDLKSRGTHLNGRAFHLSEVDESFPSSEELDLEAVAQLVAQGKGACTNIAGEMEAGSLSIKTGLLDYGNVEEGWYDRRYSWEISCDLTRDPPKWQVTQKYGFGVDEFFSDHTVNTDLLTTVPVALETRGDCRE
jgi:hypothetical protein